MNCNPDEKHVCSVVVDVDAARNSRQPASIIMTIEIINHEGSPRVPRDGKEKAMQKSDGDAIGGRGKRECRRWKVQYAGFDPR